MITFKPGDIFSEPADALVNTVNCVGAMGKGVALEIRKKYPQVYPAYKDACEKGLFKPGMLMTAHADDKTIIHFATKDDWRKPSEYAWIEAGLIRLKEWLSRHPECKVINLPALGCGNGQLEWGKVKTLISMHLADVQQNVVVFEPTPKEKAVKWMGCKCHVSRGKFSIHNIPLDCQATWNLISSGNTIGVFQLEAVLGQNWSQKAMPSSIEDLAALIALLRPGPLESGSSEQYVLRKRGIKPVEYLHPRLEPILKSTFGVLIYQEQAIRIAKEIAGFNLASADNLRKAIGKKKPEIMAQCKKQFMDGCKRVGIVTEEQAIQIFGWIETAQRYSFNKCVSESTIIRRSNNGRYPCAMTVAEMYRVRNDLRYAQSTGHEVLRRKWVRLGHYGNALSLCGDGRIRKNIIRDIQSAGRQLVYRIVLENSLCIDVTATHKFPTPVGERECRELSVGDAIFTCGQYEASDFRTINRFSNGSMPDVSGHHDGRSGFMPGKYNCAYTNGSYTQYVQFKNTEPDVCKQCGKTGCRIEVHHKDGDRSNSSNDNLVKLCVSCHKKADYAIGRRKQFDKGYPAITSKIVFIEAMGERDTYDVTMDGPNHNFVANGGIITSNSHSVAYGMLSYQSAYAKCHFPMEFYIAYLNHACQKSDPKAELSKLINDARLFGLDVMPPDIQCGNINFEKHPNKPNTISFGLAHITGIGESAISKMTKVSTWLEFLRMVPVLHRDIAQALVRAGACDGFQKARSEMLREIEIIYGANIHTPEGKPKAIRGLTPREMKIFYAQLEEGKSVTDALMYLTLPETGGILNKRKPLILAGLTSLTEKKYVDTATSKSLLERHYLGMPLSCSPVDDVEQSADTHTCLECARLPNGDNFTLCAFVEAVRHTKTKKGRNPGEPMAMLTVSDSTYTISGLVAFPNIYADICETCQEGIVAMIRGYKKNGSFIVSEMEKVT